MLTPKPEKTAAFIKIEHQNDRSFWFDIDFDEVHNLILIWFDFDVKLWFHFDFDFDEKSDLILIWFWFHFDVPILMLFLKMT